MLTRDIYLYVFQFVAALSGLEPGQVIMANQKEPRPARPYISIKMVNPSGRVGASTDHQYVQNITPEPEAPAPSIIIGVEGMRKTIASIDVFGTIDDDTLGILARVRDAIDRADIADMRAAAGVSHLGESDIRDLTYLEETKYNIRGQMDLTLGYTACSETTGDAIENVTITPTVNGKAWPAVTILTS